MGRDIREEGFLLKSSCGFDPAISAWGRTSSPMLKTVVEWPKRLLWALVQRGVLTTFDGLYI
jgi:hypothetical protein